MNGCTKRTFPSKRGVRLAHQSAGFRVRPYWCRECSGFHAACDEKVTSDMDRDPRRRRNARR